MTWKTWAAALGLGVAFTAAPSANAFDRLDGSATSGVKMDKTADILDLYAWMEPTTGIVSTVKSRGSTSGTSLHASGADTRASGSGRTEYAEHVVRSLAFWL